MIIENPYQTIDELVNASSVWFMKPYFNKPNICMFEGTIVWNGYDNHGYGSSCVKVRDLPEGAVKDRIKALIKTTIDSDFSESRAYRYYKWIGEVDVTFVERTTSGNFNLYLTKGTPHEIAFAGIDRCRVWLEQPKYKKFEIDVGNKIYYNYEMRVNHQKYLSGKVFRKTPEIEYISATMWKSIVNSFDLNFNFEEDDMVDDFYMKINNRNHKKGMTSKKFSQVFFFDLVLNDKETE